MTPDQVREVVQASIDDGHTFPWWSYVLAFLASMAGAYVGAYIKRKAEDLAARENFDAMREQLRKTVADAEQIKAALSGRSWLTQQQWSRREQRYADLLGHLHLMKLTIQDRLEYFTEPGSEFDESVTDLPHFKKLSDRGYEAYQKVRELIGSSSIFLSSHAIEELERLVREHWSAAEFSICTADYLEEALKLVNRAYDAVLAEAKVQLLSDETAI